MGKNIAFIIVTYNPDKRILKNLTYLLSNWEVIVVDNTKKNRGYAGGANVGVRKALQQGFEWLVFVNDDVIITKKTLAKFFYFF